MSTQAKNRKLWVRRALLALAALELVLLLLYWRTASAAPEEQLRQLVLLRDQHRQLGEDVRRVEQIRRNLPEVQRQCDRFLEERLLEASAGYPDLTADLSRIANASGLRASAVNYKQREIEKRGVVAVEVSAIVEGDYRSLVRFINGLERSSRFYLMDNLTLASSAGGNIKLNLQLRTYFRTRA